jgi:hypothetical protein
VTAEPAVTIEHDEQELHDAAKNFVIAFLKAENAEGDQLNTTICQVNLWFHSGEEEGFEITIRRRRQ